MAHQHVNPDTYASLNKIKDIYAKKGLTPQVISIFQKIIYDYYHVHGRNFPWRETQNPYHILVSEIMLQQTSTQRVQEKYGPFIARYPDFTALANASLPDILAQWHGLGYNRRVLFLKKIAEIITSELDGVFPKDEKTLQTLPGIGPYTAAAICAFAFNKPTLLLETNIQSVYIYFFFDGQKHIKDKNLCPLIQKTLDTHDPRHWYYALMDYGALIKKTQGNPSRKSAHYTKQSPFKCSNRQLRGLILRVLLEDTVLTLTQLGNKTNTSPDYLLHVLVQLEREGFIQWDEETITLVK